MKTFFRTFIRPAIVLFALLTIITGLAYPLATTAIGLGVLPDEANGSLIEKNGAIVGSSLIGQSFTAPQYFWGRPSATGPFPYNASASSGSNQGPLNPALGEAVKSRIAALKAADATNTQPVPVDLVTASASGLDPHISPAAAMYQVQRVANARGISPEELNAFLQTHIEGRQWGVFGEPRVNVLKLNLALDAAFQ